MMVIVFIFKGFYCTSLAFVRIRQMVHLQSVHLIACILTSKKKKQNPEIDLKEKKLNIKKDWGMERGMDS